MTAKMFHITNRPCADPEGEGTGGRGFSGNTGPDPLKNRSYQASIQCWAIIGRPAKCHLMAFRWRADYGPLIMVLPSSTKKKLSNLDPL